MSSQPSYSYKPTTMAVVNKYPDPTRTLSKSISEFFANRSFRRLFGIVGLGSTALVAYYLYSKYSESSNRKEEDKSAEVKEQPQTRPFIITEDKIEKYDYEASNAKNSNNNEDEELSEAEAETKEAQRQRDMVILYQVPRGFFTPAVAPFALKLETFMRVAKIPYTVHLSTTSHEVSTPWMRVGDDEIRDTHDCIKFLQRRFNLKLDGMASGSRKTACRMVDAVLDGHLYWAVSLWRWVYDEGRSLKEIQPMSPTGDAVLGNVKDHVSRSAYYNGLGRLSKEEVVLTAVHDLAHISSVLGKHPYFFGDSPGETDCNAFSIFSTMLWNMPGSPFEIAIKKQRNLIEYVFRMRENYWPDWNKLINSHGTAVQAPISCIEPFPTVSVGNESRNKENYPSINTGALEIISPKPNLTTEQIETMQNLHHQILLQEAEAERLRYQQQVQDSSNTRSQPEEELSPARASGGKFGSPVDPSMYADITGESEGQVSQDEVSTPEQFQKSLQRACQAALFTQPQTQGFRTQARSKSQVRLSKSFGFPVGYFNSASRPASAITHNDQDQSRPTTSQSRPNTAQLYQHQQPQQHHGQIYNRFYQ